MPVQNGAGCHMGDVFMLGKRVVPQKKRLTKGGVIFVAGPVSKGLSRNRSLKSPAVPAGFHIGFSDSRKRTRAVSQPCNMPDLLSLNSSFLVK